ncbi:MAG: AsnC family transcriptional regulator [Nitrosopumilus sp.]|uniref:AsnC family transcriptional regulator n=1 Tax=Nitrosopumilus sp. TaxID=2024843 RepID=UPI002430ACE6|nr:AsnC family transcriptional regulator [Nitrosopumilus sp.]MCV0367323.1 AsnC family transcriptional regulator [Nitrosopumilus sp.]
MAYKLDKIDTAIINSLMEDGRKSFRQISREINVSTPTVKTRFQKLLNMGLVKSVVPILDTSKLKRSHGIKLESNKKIKNGMSVKINCDYCDGPINDKPKILRFANIERFLCCNGCKTHYKEKYQGRIDSITEQYKNSKK